MNATLNQQIQDHMNTKSTDELMTIWTSNDRSQWTDQAFGAIETILTDRKAPLSVQQPLLEAEKDQVSEFKKISYTRRFCNLVLDILVFRLLALVILLPFSQMDFVEYIAANPLLDWVFGICMFTLYYVVFESAWQKSPAKFITGTKVVMADGNKPGLADIFKRTLCRFVPFDTLSGKNGSFWHDRWTDTKIVNA